MSALGKGTKPSRADGIGDDSERDTPRPGGSNALKHGAYSVARLLPWEFTVRR